MFKSFKNPLFWLALASASALCTWAAVTFYPKAFPIVQLEIKMDRQQALTAASTLAAKGGCIDARGQRRMGSQKRPADSRLRTR
jgi:hypothetical protein